MKKYLEQVKEDVKRWIEDNGDYYNLGDFKDDKYEFVEYLNDNLLGEDSVTGAASESYTFNAEEAMENVFNDIDAVAEAMKRYNGRFVAEKFLNKDYEWIDTRARMWALPRAVDEVAAEIFGE